MSKSSKRPCVLAIGGLDPGGGAGILADARAITYGGAFACAATALLTVQSTSGVKAVTALPAAGLIAECTEVLKQQRVRAIKVGALGSDENVKKVGELLAIHRDVPAVIDTVMLPSRGRARLLDAKAIVAMRNRLLRRGTLVTANIPEGEAITGKRVTRLEEAHKAARALAKLGAKAVLIKGGHLSGKHAVDVLLIDGDITELSEKRLDLKEPVHGGGCTLASFIAARLALGEELIDAVKWAKKHHHRALRNASDVGGDMRVLLA